MSEDVKCEAPSEKELERDDIHYHIIRYLNNFSKTYEPGRDRTGEEVIDTATALYQDMSKHGERDLFKRSYPSVRGFALALAALQRHGFPIYNTVHEVSKLRLWHIPFSMLEDLEA